MTIWTDLLGSQVTYAGSRYRTRVLDHGQGEALILLHGGGGHAEAFTRNVVRLGRSFHVMAIDMLWHGLSSKPPFAGEPCRWYADQVLDLLDTLGIDQAHVEGEAIGANVALYLAVHHRDRLRKIVLNNGGSVRFTSGVRRDTDAADSWRQAASAAIQVTTRETVRGRLERLFVDPSQVTDELVEVRYRFYSDPETNEAQARLRDFPNDVFEEDEVAGVSTPTLVMVGDKNPLHSVPAAQRLAELIPGAAFHLLAGSGIWSQWERAEEHDEIVAAFLQAR